MQLKVLITGINGFAGSHLADYLLSQGCAVVGTVYDKGKTGNIKHIINQIQVIECSICDASKLRNIIKEIRPDHIFHLAAITSEGVTRINPQLAFETNILGTLNLLEAVRQSKIEPMILVPGSSAEFGLTEKDENPVKETNPYRPVSPYAVSKIAQGMTAFQYYLVHKMKIIRTYTFNFIGPRQKEDFVCSAFAKQVVEIEKGIKPPVILVGNLETWRDFTDVRDVVRAYRLVVNKGISGEVYNICSGHAYSISEILEKLLSMAEAKIEVKQDLEKMRPSDVPFQVGDFGKLRKLTEWEPEIPMEVTLKDILGYWRNNL